MTGRSAVRSTGLFGVHPVAGSVLRWGARAWGVVLLVSFAILSITVGPPRNVEGDGLLTAVERPAQLGLLGLATLGWLMAWRSEAAGAVLLAVAGFGLGVFSAVMYHPVVGVLVVVAFLAPAVALWTVWQHTRSRRSIAVLAVVTVLLLGAGWAGADLTFDHFFGPTHPRSDAVLLPVDRVHWVWSGAVTARSFRVTARIAGPATAAELRVRPSVDEVASTAAVPASGVVSWTVDGLRPGTRYEYTVVVDGHPDRTRGRGSVQTFPDAPASFTVAFGACASTGSNGAVYDAIRAIDPLLYVVTGDLHYGNVSAPDVAAFRSRYDDVLTAPAQAALYRSTPVAYIWDDHDYGPNDADATSPTRSAARLAYREEVPHYPLPAGSGDAAVYQAFTVGRVRFVLTDTRSEREGDALLSAAQVAWLTEELATAARTHALVVWVNPDPWIAPAAPGRDDWGGYAGQRHLIAEEIERLGVDNLVMVSGDAHMVAIDDGSNSGYGPSGRGFPVLHAGALDRPGSVKGGPYSVGAHPGGGQFGTLTVTDDGGDRITVELAGRDWSGRMLLSHRYSEPV